jgi:hypothetical protein
MKPSSVADPKSDAGTWIRDPPIGAEYSQIVDDVLMSWKAVVAMKNVLFLGRC